MSLLVLGLVALIPRNIFSTVGSAALAMTGVLVADFMVLAFSSFELNSSMGIMTALTIAMALAADFFLLPPLLMKFDRRDYAETTTRLNPVLDRV